MLPKPECYKCHRSNVLLVSLRAPGIWFICDDCIKEQEAKDGKVAVLSYSHGLMFVSQEEAVRLTGESAQQSLAVDWATGAAEYHRCETCGTLLRVLFHETPNH